MGTGVSNRAEGTATRTQRVSQSKKKKKKKLVYNHREISGQLIRAKTSVSAKQVAARAFQKVSTLYRQLRSGDYDENKVRRAIIHAEQIAQVARKKVKHLQEEERGKRGGACEAEMEEDRGNGEDIRMESREIAESVEADSQEMEELMEELEETLELCEYAANILEAGELVPMNYPPTAKVAAYRRMENPNTEEIKDWLFELVDTLKRACRLV